jgi:hypothetical protein
MKLRTPREQQRLRRLIEEIANQVFRLQQRGLLLCVEQVEASGRLPSEIRAWANLHFLPEGSPFSCTEASIHLFVPPDVPHPIGEELRRRLRLRQAVEFEFVSVHGVVHPGVTADNWACATSVRADINEKDQLGRTALWRAAFRGYADQVMELLETGADASLPGPDGRTLLEHARQGKFRDTYIGYLLRQAMQSGSSQVRYYA